MIINVRGTSGSGKTTLARRIMAHYPERRPYITDELVLGKKRKAPLWYDMKPVVLGRRLRVLGAYERGELGPDQWRAFRLVRGTYGQRQAGDVQMLRVKIPQGILDREQLEALADVAETWSRGFGHLTTRQNMQFHFLKLLGFHDVLIDRAEGMYYYDRRGRKILDFFGGFGSLAMGHNHPRILETRREFQAEKRHEIAIAFMSQYASALASNLAAIAPGRTHYENFPVLAPFLGDRRNELALVYAFCRTTDDLGDELPGDRPAALDRWESTVRRALAGDPPADLPLLAPLAELARRRGLSEDLFLRLIEANRRDQRVRRYPDQAALLDYCEQLGFGHQFRQERGGAGVEQRLVEIDDLAGVGLV